MTRPRLITRCRSLVAGVVVATGTVTAPLDLAAHETRAFNEQLDAALFADLSSKEYFVNFIFETTRGSNNNPGLDGGRWYGLGP